MYIKIIRNEARLSLREDKSHTNGHVYVEFQLKIAKKSKIISFLILLTKML